MQIAVTGGSGFIGSHVVDCLMGAGHDVVVLDRRPPHRSDAMYREVDILDLDDLVDATRSMDTIFHLAAVADVNEAALEPVRTWELNVVATARVWEAARRNAVRRTILASTVWVYGGAVGAPPLDEKVPFAVQDFGHVYTSSKIAAEMVAHACHALYDQEFTVLRYGIPYGPRMRPALVVPRFVEAALSGETLAVQGDGSQYRNYVYVEDLARAHVLVLGEAGANATFNLEGREPVSIRRLVDGIAAVLGPVEVEYGEARVGDYEGRPVSAEKAARELGWNAATPFEDGLRRYIDWHVAERGTAQQPAAALVSALPAAGPPKEDRPRQPVAAMAGITASLVLIPLLLGPTARTIAGEVPLAGAVLLAAGVASLVSRQPRRMAPAVLGAGLVTASVWLLSQTSSLSVVALIAVALGAGVGLVLPQSRAIPPSAALAGGAVLVALAGLGQPHVLALGADLMATVAALVIVRGTRTTPSAVSDASAPRASISRRLARPSVAFCAVATVLTVALTSWVGATSASASWFGAIVSHGPRSTSRVALTFDAPDSVQSVDGLTTVLDRYGVKATFFAEGATSADRAAARQLLAAGHDLGALVDDGSRIGLLSPRYTIAGHSQHEMLAGVGICPAFLRPRDGQHTPLTAYAVHRRGMQVVGWEISPGSRHSRDSLSLALAVLRDVRPGSIINVRGSPAVVVGALPLIIDGLRARGLEPVTLDQLLHVAPYTSSC